jgi:AcrR family transcriptional regulator
VSEEHGFPRVDQDEQPAALIDGAREGEQARKGGPGVGKAARHKQNLVRTAMRLFRRQGYASTGLQQIVDESGAPKGSLYHYFPSGKEALGEFAVVLAGGLIREMLEDLAARHADPKALLRAYCRTLAGWMEESRFQSGRPMARIRHSARPILDVAKLI